MLTPTAYQTAQRRAAELLRKIGVVLTADELAQIKVADFGLSELEQSGGQILTLVDTEEIAVKLIALFPGQCLPEHRHPPLGEYPGKAETLRCEWGVLYLCEEGDATLNTQAHPPAHRQQTYTAWRESVLHPGDLATSFPSSIRGVAKPTF